MSDELPEPRVHRDRAVPTWLLPQHTDQNNVGYLEITQVRSRPATFHDLLVIKVKQGGQTVTLEPEKLDEFIKILRAAKVWHDPEWDTPTS